MKATHEAGMRDALTRESLDLLINEAERALMSVDARNDEPGHRMLNAGVDEGLETDANADEAQDILQLRLAVAQLTDAHVGIQAELERLQDRIRLLGPRSAFEEITRRPHLLDLARLSLEIFFRLYPMVDAYEIAAIANVLDRDGLMDDTPAENYAALFELKALLHLQMN